MLIPGLCSFEHGFALTVGKLVLFINLWALRPEHFMSQGSMVEGR